MFTLQLVPEGTLALGIVATILLCGIAFLLGVAYLDHRKEVLLIETGEYEHRESRAWILAVGLLLLAWGLGAGIEALAAGQPIESVVQALVGLAALTYYFVRRREDRANQEQSGGEAVSR